MADGTVEITAPLGRFVYIDGNYADPRPRLIPCVFLVELGPALFETLNTAFRIDYRGHVVVTPTNRHIVIALDPVTPPAPATSR